MEPIRPLNLVLAAITLVTMTLAGQAHAATFIYAVTREDLSFWVTLWMGFYQFALPAFLIVSAHSAGHIIACRKHLVPVTAPFMIPFFPPAGGLGSFVRVRKMFPTRAAQCDFGLAGPLYTFVCTLIVLAIGVAYSVPTDSVQRQAAVLRFPWILYVFAQAEHHRAALHLHPTAYAGLFGLFVTFLNTLPVGNLDGGKVVTALWPSGATVVSITTAIVLAAVAWINPNWILIFIAASVMVITMGANAPVINDATIRPSHWVSLVAILTMVALCSLQAGR